MRRGLGFGADLAALVLAIAAPAGAQVDETVQPPPHVAPWPDIAGGQGEDERAAGYALGPELTRGVPAREILRERRRLDAGLAGLEPERRGTVDAYIVSIALDSDPVFAREAREAGRVLARRFDGEGRTLVLAGPDGTSAGLPRGSITALTIALAHLSDIMDTEEDVLVLYATSHGAQVGLAYHDGDTGYGVLSPARLRSILEELGIERRILILSACYSGVFVPGLASDDTAIITAAAWDRTSFGCEPDNDWTFFGDALINRALRQPQSLAAAVRAAQAQIVSWEIANELTPSLPQLSIGPNVASWLTELEARMPLEPTEPVGRSSASGRARE